MTNYDRKYASDMIFMALVLWREARGEPEECKIGVAYSIMNRVRKPKWWGKTIMEVISKKWQYSSMTDPNDKQLVLWPKEDSVWWECVRIADDVMHGVPTNPVPGADSYHDISIPAPKWATNFVKQIGRIKFYNVDNDYEV